MKKNALNERPIMSVVFHSSHRVYGFSFRNVRRPKETNLWISDGIEWRMYPKKWKTIRCHVALNELDGIGTFHLKWVNNHKCFSIPLNNGPMIIGVCKWWSEMEPYCHCVISSYPSCLPVSTTIFPLSHLRIIDDVTNDIYEWPLWMGHRIFLRTLKRVENSTNAWLCTLLLHEIPFGFLIEFIFMRVMLSFSFLER